MEVKVHNIDESESSDQHNESISHHGGSIDQSTSNNIETDDGLINRKIYLNIKEENIIVE